MDKAIRDKGITESVEKEMSVVRGTEALYRATDPFICVMVRKKILKVWKWLFVTTNHHR